MASIAAGGVQAKPDGLITREAARDLSSYQYHAMYMASDGQIDYSDTSAGSVGLNGILQNKPDAEGEEAEIATEGTSLMVVNGSTAIAVGDKLGSTSDYHGLKVTADKAAYFAIAMEAATADGDIIEVKLLGGVHYIGA